MVQLNNFIFLFVFIFTFNLKCIKKELDLFLPYLCSIIQFLKSEVYTTVVFYV